MGRNFRSIKAWQLAGELVVVVYEATKSFPDEERYGLVAQMRRAAISIAANIAEGATRNSPKEYAQFLSVAKGSAAELECYLHLSRRLGYLTEERYHTLLQLYSSTAKTLHGLCRFIELRKGLEPVFARV